MSHTTLLLSLAFVLLWTHADALKVRDAEYATTKTRYLIYSGGLGDTVPPQANNKKLLMMFEGQFAREIF